MLKKDNARTIRSYCSYLGDLAETSRFRRCLQRIEGIVALLCNLRSEGNDHERSYHTLRAHLNQNMGLFYPCSEGFFVKRIKN